MRYLLVDGHSVIFGWQDLRKLHAKRMSLARDDLIRQLTEYQDASGVRVVLVFDGRGEKIGEETTPGGIQIFYSSAGKTADSVIERLVASYGAQHEMTVATADNLERQTAMSFGAVVITLDGLRASMDEAKADLARRLKTHSRKSH